MQSQLQDKVAVVTGASRGIGRAIAVQLAAEGTKVVVAARSADLLEETVALCGKDCAAIALDLREPDAPARMIEFAVDKFGRLDVLVNNAGATKRGDFLTLPDEDWTDGFALKFYAAMRACRAAWPHLVAAKGAIVNIVGVGGRTGSAEFTIGGSVNAAVLNLTKALADRGVKDGVRVNAINPGGIATERFARRIANLARERGLDEVAAKLAMAEKLGVARIGTPQEIANAVVFLASPLSSYCQGAILDVDGGQTRTL